jgi:drug/metabolite transporter (DMT)-like permease
VSRIAARGGWTTHAALLVVQVAFASQAVESKLAMMDRAAGGEGIAPEALAMARMVGAALFFQVFARATGKLVPTSWREQAWLAVLSVLGIALNQALFLAGLRLTTPTAAALLSITIPVGTAVLAILFRQERPSFRTWLGLALAASGVVWLTGITGTHGVDKGALIIALNSLSYASYIVLSRGVIQRLGAVTVVTWAFTWAVPLFAPFGAPSLLANAAVYTSRGWWLIGYIVLVPTIVAYLLNAWALGRSNPSLVTVYIFLQPILAASLAWVQLGQALSSRLVFASVFIACGVAVVATRKTSAVVPAPPPATTPAGADPGA